MFPSRRITIHSSLPIEAAVVALAAACEPWERAPVTDRDAEQLRAIHFIGEVETKAFTVKTRAEAYRRPDLSFAGERNLMRPACKGRIVEGETGSLVHVQFRVRTLLLCHYLLLGACALHLLAGLVLPAMNVTLSIMVMVVVTPMTVMRTVIFRQMASFAEAELNAVFRSR